LSAILEAGHPVPEIPFESRPGTIATEGVGTWERWQSVPSDSNHLSLGDSIMAFFCAQCHQPILTDPIYCPNCGPFQKLSPRQAARWLARHAAIGAGVGLVAGAVAMLPVAVAVSLGGGGFAGFWKTAWILVRLGAVCGAMLGAVA